jgi:hypothetical protein
MQCACDAGHPCQGFLGGDFRRQAAALKRRRLTEIENAGRSISRTVTAFVAVANLLDAVYDVGGTPTSSVGLPRSARRGALVVLPSSEMCLSSERGRRWSIESDASC